MGCQTVDRGSFGDFERSLNTKPYGYKVIEDFTGEAPSKVIGAWSDCTQDRERTELSGPKDNYRDIEYWYG